MNLAINFVWIGQNKLGWLECFMIYSWKLWGCGVNVFTHYPNSEKKHDHESLGLPPNIVKVFDLPEMVAVDVGLPETRGVLARWFATAMPKWDQGGKQLTFNMADLSKSFLAATTKGIVMDLKIGPSPHIKRYVDTGIFSSAFIGCKRVSTIENQLMGSMSDDNTKRTTYGNAFESFLFDKKKPPEFKAKPGDEWFPYATLAHGRAMGNVNTPQGLKGDWFDIGKYGKQKHLEQLRISHAEFEGIAGEKEAGAVRVFKREMDQSNKFNNPSPTSDAHRLEAQRVAFWELAQASVGSGSPIDVTAEGMPPITDMLALLTLTRKP